jgi:hypothetical protein
LRESKNNKPMSEKITTSKQTEYKIKELEEKNEK